MMVGEKTTGAGEKKIWQSIGSELKGEKSKLSWTQGNSMQGPSANVLKLIYSEVKTAGGEQRSIETVGAQKTQTTKRQRN